MGGYYFVGVRRGELDDRTLSSESVRQIKETARLLRGSKIGDYLPKVVYSDGSPEGDATAWYLANLLGIVEGVEVNEAFSGEGGFRTAKKWFGLITTRVPVGPVERMIRELTWLERGVSSVNIAVCASDLLRNYLLGAYGKFGKLGDSTETEIALKPGECFISQNTDVGGGFQLKMIFPSKGREDVLADR